jgi:dipeptidyl-peptidase-4
MRYKYPKAGEKNSVASAHIYQLSDGKKTTVNLDSFKNYYIPNVIQTAKPDEIVLITSDRIQNASDILKVNTKQELYRNYSRKPMKNGSIQTARLWNF